MASEQGMSGIDVKAMTSELCAKLPLWIDKVYQFDSRTWASGSTAKIRHDTR